MLEQASWSLSQTHVPGRQQRGSLHFMVRGIALMTAVLAVQACLPLRSAAEQPNWVRDLDVAKREASASGRNLFIVFTGHGNCAYCDVLDREVFQKSTFVHSTKNNYVFVELDYNFGDTPEEKQRRQRLDKHFKDYLIHGIPTVVLADAAGVPYSFATGYSTGVGPVRLLAPMMLAELALRTRDHYFSLANSGTGQERVENLHKGIQSVALLLGSMTDRGDDPVLHFYQDQIDEILKTDQSTGAKIKSLYEARRKKRDDWLAQEAVIARLKDFEASKDNKGACAFVAEALKTTTDVATRFRLEGARQVYLEWDGQYAAALENARRLLTLPGLEPSQRESFLHSEAYNLFSLGRIDEGLAHYDRRIGLAANDENKRVRLLFWKAQMILNRNRPEQSVQAWREYRAATKPETEPWQEATALLARELRKAGQDRAALEISKELLKSSEYPGVMLDAAEIHIKLGEPKEARELFDKAEKATQTLKASERNADKSFAGRLEAQLQKVRGQLAGTKP